MKTYKYIIIVLALISCGDNSKSVPTNIIAELKDGVVCVDYDDIPKTKTVVPLSDLIEDLEIIQLDGSTKEAYISNSLGFISDSYLLKGFISSTSIKLFERKTGKFLGNVGTRGNGPGEYLYVHSGYIDETNKKIYLFPFNGDKILVYDLNRKFLGNIPLIQKVSGALISVDTQLETITVMNVPYKGKGSKLIWQQDFKGNEIVSSINRWEISRYTSNAAHRGNVKDFDYSISTAGPIGDTLFNYIPSSNTIKAVFALSSNQFPRKASAINDVLRYFIELPTYYLAAVSIAKVEKFETSVSYTPNQTNLILVDKKSLTGGFITLYNDYLGGMNISYPYLYKGYYISGADPMTMINRLTEAKKTATGESLKRIEKLLSEIDEEGNNVIMFGKLKNM